MMKKFTTRYVKLHKCKLRDDDPSSSMLKSEHCVKDLSYDDYDKEERDYNEMPMRTSLVETIEKVLVARKIQQQQQQKAQLALAVGVSAKK